MVRVLAYIYEDMAEFETVFALNILGCNPEVEVSTVAESTAPVRTRAGMTYVPDYSFEDAMKLDDVMAMIIPGGWGGRQSAGLTALIKKLDDENCMFGAICRGPAFLARAGVLDDTDYTTTWTPELSSEAGEDDPFDRNYFRDENVVVDGRFITAKGAAFVDFAVAVLDYFEMFEDFDDREEFRRKHKGL